MGRRSARDKPLGHRFKGPLFRFRPVCVVKSMLTDLPTPSGRAVRHCFNLGSCYSDLDYLSISLLILSSQLQPAMLALATLVGLLALAPSVVLGQATTQNDGCNTPCRDYANALGYCAGSLQYNCMSTC